MSREARTGLSEPPAAEEAGDGGLAEPSAEGEEAYVQPTVTRRTGDPNPGGTTGIKRVTAYRQDALRCAAHLATHGPASINPATGKPYGLSFPVVTIRDFVEVQRALLDSLGADGTKIVATALNNYSVEIPIDTITDEAPIVAYHIDGETFSRRDKGPLWIVYPYDSSEDYRTELVFGWSIWQLAKLSIVK